MEGIGMEAARKLAIATTQLQQLEGAVSEGATQLRQADQLLVEKRRLLHHLKRSTEEHHHHHNALLAAIDALNERNRILQKEIKTKAEVKANLQAHLDEQGTTHQRMAQDIDQRAMNIQMLSARLEMTDISAGDEASKLKSIVAQKTQVERDRLRSSLDLSRVRVYAQKAQRESDYVEQTLVADQDAAA